MSKKVIFTRVLALIMVLSLPIANVSVSASPDSDWIYTLSNDGSRATLDRYVGPGGHVVVPAEIGGVPVVSLGWGMFYLQSVQPEGNVISEERTDVETVTLPASISSISRSVFTALQGLQAIEVDPNNQYFTSVDGVLFTRDRAHLRAFPSGKSTTYAIPDGTEIIGNDAFRNNRLITNVIFPESVMIIGQGTFRDSTALTDLVFLEFVSIYQYAFLNTTFTNATFLGDGGFTGDAFQGRGLNLTLHSYEGSSIEETAERWGHRFAVHPDAATSNRTLVRRDLTNLILPEILGPNRANAVETNLNLRSTGVPNGSVITWASEPPLVSATGVVTRPSAAQGDTEVRLMATFTKGNISMTRYFDITVLALPAEEAPQPPITEPPTEPPLPTATPTSTITPTPTVTPTSTTTITVTPTPTWIPSPPSRRPRALPPSQPTSTPTPTLAPTITPTPTLTPVPAPAVIATPTPPPTPVPSFTTLNDFRLVALTLADSLFELGLFVGTGVDSAGRPTYELNRQLSRMEALVIVIRLMGLESRANEFTGANPFTDTPDWGRDFAAFAYSEGIAFGVGGGQFAPNRYVTYQEFTAFLLRVLGYSESNGDFAFAQALNKAVEVGLYSSNQRNVAANATQFTRADTVVSMVNALMTNSRGTTTRLIDRLVADDVISRGAANRFIAEATRVMPFLN